MAFQKPKCFSDFTEEEQNFILDNNFDILKKNVLDWKEVRTEWRKFLLQEEAKIGISNLRFELLTTKVARF